MIQTIFTIGSGRCGTYLIHKILSLYSNVESYHEFCIEHTQKLSVLHRAGVVSTDHAALQLRETYLSMAWYSQVDILAISDNKLSYLTQPLRVILPDSRFIHLVRDGRRVCSSYYSKLSKECYTDFWVAALDKHIHKPRIYPTPPPLKPCFWPCPNPIMEHKVYHNFIYEWNRWQRLCWYWQDCNRVIMKDLEGVPDSQKYFIRLEDLTSYIMDLVELLMDWLGLNNEYIVDAWNLCQTPQNVSEPVSYPLTGEQEQQYWEICGEMHERLGYGKSDYEVEYGGSR